MRICRTRDMWNHILRFWYQHYAIILAAMITYLLLAALKKDGSISIVSSANMPNALDAVMTFTSIVLGFVGVLVATIAGLKKETKIIQYFLEHVDKKYFLNVVKKEICSGLSTALITIMLYFPEELAAIFDLEVIRILFALWLFLLLYFLFSTYRLMSLLLRMIFDNGEDKNLSSSSPGIRLSDDKRQAMEEQYAKKSQITR